MSTKTALILCVCLLSGCIWQEGVRQDIEEYSSRLSRVLNTEIVTKASAQTLNYPTRRALLIPLQSKRINLTEFQSLQQCELGTLVAERNTTLGKNADVAATWIYHTSLLTALDNCANAIDITMPELARTLRQWHEEKATQTSAVWTNLLQTSNETVAAFSRSADYLTRHDNRDASGGITALAYLAALPQQPHQNTSELISQLKLLSSSRIPAKIWRTQRLLAETLSRLTAELKGPLASVSCPSGSASRQAEILRNVFYLFFVERIQPVASLLNRYHYRLQPVWQDILRYPTISPMFSAYVKLHSEDSFERYQQAMNDHVELWQRFLKRCDLSPSAPSRS